jgi:hypothetical protein
MSHDFFAVTLEDQMGPASVVQLCLNPSPRPDKLNVGCVPSSNSTINARLCDLDYAAYVLDS